MNETGAFQEELKAVFDASNIVHNAMMLSRTVDERQMIFRVHSRLCQHFRDLSYLHSLEHDVIIEKMKLEYE